MAPPARGAKAAGKRGGRAAAWPAGWSTFRTTPFRPARSIPMQATTSIAAPRPAAQPTAARSPGRSQLPQYSLRQILCIWAAAAVPMALLAWVVAPLIADHLSGPGALSRALIMALTVGLVWQFVLVMFLVRRE